MLGAFVADRRPGLGAVPGRADVKDRAEVDRAVLGRTWGELSSVIMSCEPELRRRCGGCSPRGDSGADMVKEERAGVGSKRVLLSAMCAACKWNAQEGNDVRSALQEDVRAVGQAEGGRLLGIAAGGEQKKGRREERKWRVGRLSQVRQVRQERLGTPMSLLVGVQEAVGAHEQRGERAEDAAAAASACTAFKIHGGEHGLKLRTKISKLEQGADQGAANHPGQPPGGLTRRLHGGDSLQPLARPLPHPGLNLLGLEAQPQQPIQQHVSTLNSLPCATTAAICQSTERIANITPGLADIAVMRCPRCQPPLPLST
ncbi:hypothetical protein OPT61_g7708 [Boeremia exigua]|uniref:Uncharacterized protein n=1 Tax=Boeremia exigua TaxID=749465 RepID=A0ACC2I1I1_9PLEO|nr:hypothetical protein OPT61_g7708 [Boeremia exigua]